MFVGSSKIVESVLALQSDRFLDPRPDRTVIYLGSIFQNGKLKKNPTDVLQLYQQFGIDTSSFAVVHDIDILEHYRQLDLYGTFNFWIRQQLIKFMALDSCGADQVLIQDADILITQPYCYFSQTHPRPMTLPDITHEAQYYKLVESLIGQPRLTQESFITEILPLRHSDWQTLAQHIERTWQMPWLRAMINLLEQQRTTVSLLRQQPGKVLFSEYEIIGNWLLTRPDIHTLTQRKYCVNAQQVQAIKARNFCDQEYDPCYHNSVHFLSYENLPRLDVSDIDYCNKIFFKKGGDNA